jgi:hypothetical protein
MIRLAFHALHTTDSYLRGTALEYLETVLPETTWTRLWPLVEQGEQMPIRSRDQEQVMQDLMASRLSISAAMGEDVHRPDLQGDGS